MLLVRFGDTGGVNLDMLLAWELIMPPPPEPEPEPPLPGKPNEPPLEGGDEPPTEPAPEGDTTLPPAGEAPQRSATEDEEPPHAGSWAPTPGVAPLEEPPTVMTMTMHFAGGAAVHDVTLKGAEAEAMVSYLNAKSGALVRPASG